jgi:hypothetical protein
MPVEALEKRASFMACRNREVLGILNSLLEELWLVVDFSHVGFS